MAKMVRITGINAVLAKIKAETTKTNSKFEQGLYLAGLHLQRESQKIVPVDKGILKNSAFTRKSNSTTPDVIVGYTANYAVFVHENLDATHKPGKQAKFLEEPLRREQGKIVNIVKQHLQGR